MNAAPTRARSSGETDAPPIGTDDTLDVSNAAKSGWSRTRETIVGIDPHTRTRSRSMSRNTSPASNFPSRNTSRPPDRSVVMLVWMPAR